MNSIAINRKPVFDAVRRMLGRGFTRPEIALLDRAIDAAVGSLAETAGHILGRLSERFESGGRGPGTVSSGVSDPGGVSYGTYQLASRTGTAEHFVKTEGARWAGDFGRAVPGSAEFSRIWRAIADREPDAFGQAQHAFIERTHYRPAVETVFIETDLDLDARHAAVRDATWSVAVQHGGASRILKGGVAQADENASRDDAAAYDRALVHGIYSHRIAYVLRVAERSSMASARTLRLIVRDRYPAELEAALAMLDG